MERKKPCGYLQNTKIMYMDWNCYGGRDMKQALLACGIEVSLYPFDPRTGRNALAFEKDFSFAIRSFSPQFVFSFNYFPVISKVCSELVTRKCTADISFIGSLCTEPKHQLYQRIKDLPDRTRGYLDTIMQTQKQVYGASFLEELLTEEVLSDLHRAYPCPPNSDGVETESYLYSNYFLLRHVTTKERTELIRKICKNILCNCIPMTFPIPASAVSTTGRIQDCRSGPGKKLGYS